MSDDQRGPQAVVNKRCPKAVVNKRQRSTKATSVSQAIQTTPSSPTSATATKLRFASPSYPLAALELLANLCLKRSLRKCDFEEFKAELIAFINLYNEAAGGAAEGVERMNEHKQAAFSKIEGFPELVADFDQFLTASKVVMRRPTAMQYQGAVAPELANL